MNASNAAKLALEALYPKRCLWCGRVVGFTGETCCGEDAAAVALPVAPLALQEEHGAAEHIAEAWALYRYAEPVRGAIRRCKFDGEVALGREMGLLLAGLCKQSGLAAWADCLIPVPMAKKEKHRRGYNQTELLALPIAKQTGLPLDAGSLVKLRETRRQSALNEAERHANIAGAFGATDPKAIQGENILLADDIITTGSTLNECAKTLLEAGAAGVRAICVAATKRQGRELETE